MYGRKHRYIQHTFDKQPFDPLNNEKLQWTLPVIVLD